MCPDFHSDHTNLLCHQECIEIFFHLSWCLTLLLFLFLMTTFLAGVKKNLNVILICDAQLVNDAKHIFSCVYWSRFIFSACRSALRLFDSVLEANLRCISLRMIQLRIPIKRGSVEWGDQVCSEAKAEASDSSQQSWWSVMIFLFWSLLSDWRAAALGQLWYPLSEGEHSYWSSSDTLATFLAA